MHVTIRGQFEQLWNVLICVDFFLIIICKKLIEVNWLLYRSVFLTMKK